MSHKERKTPPPVCARCPYGRHYWRAITGHYCGHAEPGPLWTPDLRADYLAYLANAYARAESATRGHMVTRAGERRRVTGWSYYGPGRRPLDRHASDELRDHWREHGKPLTWAAYAQQASEVAA